jgi:hypothetical protein
MIMKRNLYQEIGGFDENCFMYSDDIDLSYMALKKGKTNYYFHETTVIHYKGESTVKDGLYMKHFREAMQFFYRKHFRSSIIFDVFMKIGAFFFALIKKNQSKLKPLKAEEYVLFSKNEKLKNKLENLFHKKVHWQSQIEGNILFSHSILNKTQTEIIFDNTDLSFKEIISFLEANKNQGFTFKIIPKNTFFMIGSNNSNDKGTVIKID